MQPLRLVLLALLVALGPIAAATDLVTERAYVDDPSAQMTLA